MSDSPAYTSLPSSTSKAYLDRAYALQSPAEARTLYDEWARSYDADLSGIEYVFHRHAAGAVLQNLGPNVDVNRKLKVKVLDAGCGTGLVGRALREEIVRVEGMGKGGGKVGRTDTCPSQEIFQGKIDPSNIDFEITGIDISPGMLDVARKTGLYTTLEEVDLMKLPLKYTTGSYDVVVCVGTLTRGHVGPEVLGEFVRVTKTDGIIVATVLEEIWEIKGFERETERLAGTEQEVVKEVEVLGVERVGVVKGAEEGGRLVVLRKV